jgi:hypothetical protein
MFRWQGRQRRNTAGGEVRPPRNRRRYTMRTGFGGPATTDRWLARLAGGGVAGARRSFG